jgi:hypothetical protein
VLGGPVCVVNCTKPLNMLFRDHDKGCLVDVV